MKKAYDFSKYKRTKNKREKTRQNISITLESDIFLFIENISENKNEDFDTIVNELLRRIIKTIEYIKL